MNQLTAEWVEKAEGDFLTLNREYRVRKEPNFDAVCFHAQQSAEKYLKAFLQETGKPIPRIHSLAELLGLIQVFDPSFLVLQPVLNTLEEYAVQFRYPGASAEKTEAKAALSAAELVRKFVRAKLGIS